MQSEIISRLNLKETNVNLGQSYVYRLKVYSFMDRFYLANCNALGQPSTNGKVLVTDMFLKWFYSIDAKQLMRYTKNELLKLLMSEQK